MVRNPADFYSSDLSRCCLPSTRDPVYNPDELIEHLSDGLETLLTNNPGCRVILAGDINQLELNTLMHQFSLSQLVKKPTRGNNILNVFLTNTPFEFSTVKYVDSLIDTDHKSIIVNPRTRAKATRKRVELRDTRAHCKLAMFDFLKDIDWLAELSGENIDSAVSHFYSLINPEIDIFFPVQKIKVSSNDPVFVSPLVKYLLRKRNGFFKKGMLDEANALQPRVDHLILENQVGAIKSTNAHQGNVGK